MLQGVFLDAGPLGMAAQRRGIAEAEACRRWVNDMTNAGVRIIVPEVTDFEIRRELLRAGKTSAVLRLDSFIMAHADRYLPITTDAMRLAAGLWADARNKGVPTADARALNADVILAAQALTAGMPLSDIAIASVNVRHISRCVTADLWSNTQL